MAKAVKSAVLATSQPASTQKPVSENRPVHTIRYNNVKSTIWRNESQAGVFYTVTVLRSWKDDAGEWHDTTSFHFKDLPNLAKTITDSHSWIAWQERNREGKGGPVKAAAASGKSSA